MSFMFSTTTLKRLAGITIATACLALSTTGSAQALTLKFDDLTSTNPFAIYDQISTSYGGLNWSNFYFENGTADSFSNTGYASGIVSPKQAVFNGGGQFAEITSSANFTFNSTYLTAALNNGLNILIEGYQGTTLLESRSVTVDTTSPTLFSFNWSGINRLKFNASGGIFIDNPDYGPGEQFVMDNFTFNELATPVPTPALLPGLIGLGLGVLRKRKSAAAA
jgi:hypothetical protein